MRGLFVVYIVDPDGDEVVAQVGPLVARDEDNARLKAVQKMGDSLTEDVDDLDIVVVRLGDVRGKGEVQKVEVVKE